MNNDLEGMFGDQGKGELHIQIWKGTQLAAVQAQNTCRGAQWRFYSNNQFVFTPPVDALSSRLFPLVGMYSEVDELIRLRGEKIIEADSTSIDGVARIEGDNLILDIVYTLSVQTSTQQILRIIQTLTRRQVVEKGEFNLEDNLIPVESRSANQSINPLETDNFENEMIQIFKVCLKGQTEAGVFDSLPGHLFLTPNKDSEFPAGVQLLIDPESLIGNGGIVWTFENSKTLASNSQIEGNSHHFRIQALEGTPQVAWYTLPLENPSSDPTPVTVENAVLSLTIQDKRITGNIQGSGVYSTGSSEIYPSIYQARVTGELEKSSLVEDLRAILNTSIFAGCWQMDKGTLGKIELQQKEEKVQGVCTGLGDGKGGTISGIVQGNRLDFVWTAGESEGWGFFRALNQGGTLVGVLSSDYFSISSQCAVADWQLPAFLRTAMLDSVDMRELRWLGHELAIQNRREQAVAILDLVLNLYREERKKPETSSQRQVDCLTNEVFTLSVFLPNCNFQLGNYGKLLENLEHMMEVLHWLSPAESASRLFRERTTEIVKTLKFQGETFDFFEGNFIAIRQVTSGNSFKGVVGIYIKQDEQSNFLRILDIEENSSAQLAGILPEDIIIAIDDCNTRGIDVRQASAKLSGDPETQVKLVVQRENQELEFVLSRKRVEFYPPHRLNELVEFLSIFAEYFSILRSRINNYLQEITEVETKLVMEQENPVTAWISLSQDIKEQKSQLDTDINRLLALRIKIFQDDEVLLKNFESLLNMFPHNHTEFLENTFNLKELMLLEERITYSIKNNQNFSVVEKKLFQAYIESISMLISFLFQLDSHYQFLSKINAKKLFEENRKRSEEMGSRLATYIERWRTQLIDDLDKVDALEKGQPFFQKLIPFLIKLDNKSEALVASENSRARAFADLLATRFASTSKPEAIPRSITANSPTMMQIQQIAQKQKTTLIEYTIVYNLESQYRESKLFIWIVQPTGKVEFSSVDLEFLKHTNNTSLEELVNKAHASMAIKNEELTDFDSSFIVNNNSFNPYLQQLYQILIESISEFLPDDPNVPLVFIPHSFLFLTPFPALQDKEGNFLVQKHTILTAPSIQVLDLTHESGRKVLDPFSNALVVGNPRMPSLRRAINEEPQQLKPLPVSGAEATVIASLLNTQAIIADEATKISIVEQMPKAGLVHLATHGILDDIRELGIPGAIALAPYKDDSGLLTAAEIMEMFGQPHKLTLQAELLVLSACATGLGKVTGDGVIGLSRSLMAVGVSRLVVSLWSVSDLSTAFLMIKFYEILKDSIYLEPAGVAKALNQAQKWLAHLSNMEAKQEFEKLKPYIYQAFTGRSQRVAQAYINKYLEVCERASYPFANPKYWAAFTTIGL